MNFSGKQAAANRSASLADWQGCVPVGNEPVKGQYVHLEGFNPDESGKAVAAELWEAFGGLASNQLLHFFPWPDFAGPQDLFEKLQAQARMGWLCMVFRDAKTSKAIGMASYMRDDPKNGVIEIGCVAHSAAMAASAAATEVHYLLAKRVFEEHGYRRYEWKCHNGNERSKISAVRYGFTFEGVFRNHVISRGENRDTAWFSMIDSEWPLIARAFETWLDPSNFDDNGRQKRRLEDIRNALA